MAFDQEALSVGSGADCGSGSPGSTGGTLYAGHGIVATTQYAGEFMAPCRRHRATHACPVEDCFPDLPK